MFRVDEAPQGFGGGHRGRGGFRGRHIGGIGQVSCYNCEEKGHLAGDFPLSIIPWCVPCKNNIHATKDCLELITKWEENARKRGSNLINFEPQPINQEKEPNINIITRGGTRNGVDVDNPTQSKIQKVVLVDAKYDPIRHNEFFQNAVEIFRHMSKPAILAVVEPSVEIQPRVAKNMFSLKDPPTKSQNTIDLWFQLFFEILDEKKLTKTLWNMLKGTLETEGSQEKLIIANLPERNTSRI